MYNNNIEYEMDIELCLTLQKELGNNNLLFCLPIRS